MGDLIAVFKIMPEAVETDLSLITKEVEKVVPDGVTLENTEEKPVAFGLKALHVTLSMEDTEEISVDGIEEALADIEGVESVSCEDVGRV